MVLKERFAEGLRLFPGRLSGLSARSCPKDESIEQGISTEPVRPVNTDTGALSSRKQPRERCLSVKVRFDSSHGVMLGGLNRNGFVNRVNPSEVDGDLPNTGEKIEDLLSS